MLVLERDEELPGVDVPNLDSRLACDGPLPLRRMKSYLVGRTANRTIFRNTCRFEIPELNGTICMAHGHVSTVWAEVDGADAVDIPAFGHKHGLLTRQFPYLDPTGTVPKDGEETSVLIDQESTGGGRPTHAKKFLIVLDATDHDGPGPLVRIRVAP